MYLFLKKISQIPFRSNGEPSTEDSPPPPPSLYWRLDGEFLNIYGAVCIYIRKHARKRKRGMPISEWPFALPAQSTWQPYLPKRHCTEPVWLLVFEKKNCFGQAYHSLQSSVLQAECLCFSFLCLQETLSAVRSSRPGRTKQNSSMRFSMLLVGQCWKRNLSALEDILFMVIVKGHAQLGIHVGGRHVGQHAYAQVSGSASCHHRRHKRSHEHFFFNSLLHHYHAQISTSDLSLWVLRKIIRKKSDLSQWFVLQFSFLPWQA